MVAPTTEVAAVRGRAKKQASMLAFVDPEALIPADHPLRTIKRVADAALLELSPLFDEMYASLADRSTRQLLKRLARLDVILIDEFGYLNLKPEQSNIFFKLMEERYRHHSTIITTNLGYDEWPNFLGNRPMVEALLSRLRHYCHTVHIKGPSLREPQG